MALSKERIAIFIDAENVAGWIKRGGVEELLEELSSIGHTIVRRAYGVWSRGELAIWQSELNRLGFELIHCYHPVSGKNASDIQMVVDVMEYVSRIEEIGWFALATGDSDFSPLFRRLRELGKEVVGIGPRSPLSESVKSSCSRYIYTDTKADEQNKEQRLSDFDDALETLDKILEDVEEPIHISLLKQRMMTIDSAFSEKRLGFKSFYDFLQATNLVRLFNINDHTWMAEPLSEASSSEPPHTKAPSKSSVETYQAILRQAGVRLAPKATLLSIWRILRGLSAPSRDALALRVVEQADEHLSLPDVRKVISLFSKARAFIVKGEGNKTSWEIDRSLKEEELLRTLDSEIAFQLMQKGKLSAATIDKKALAELLYGNYDSQSLEALINSR
ncbi:MAG: NYN domain-containing protein [Campylobacterales bacterium]